jgi:hypothetical protein
MFTACPLFAEEYALHSKGLTERCVPTGIMPSNDMLALVVPLLLLVIAIRRNSGVLAAILLLTLFIVRL